MLNVRSSSYKREIPERTWCHLIHFWHFHSILSSYPQSTYFSPHHPSIAPTFACLHIPWEDLRLGAPSSHPLSMVREQRWWDVKTNHLPLAFWLCSLESTCPRSPGNRDGGTCVFCRRKMRNKMQLLSLMSFFILFFTPLAFGKVIQNAQWRSHVQKSTNQQMHCTHLLPISTAHIRKSHSHSSNCQRSLLAHLPKRDEV